MDTNLIAKNIGKKLFPHTLGNTQCLQFVLNIWPKVVNTFQVDSSGKTNMKGFDQRWFTVSTKCFQVC